MDESPSTASAAPRRAPGWMRFIAFWLALLLVIIAPVAWLAFDLWRVVFNPPLVKSIVTDEVASSDLVPVGLAWFSEQRAAERLTSDEAPAAEDEPDIVLLLSYMDRDDWRAIRQEILTYEILSQLVAATVDGVYDWIDSADRIPDVVWDARPLKARVFSEHGANAIAIAYDNLAPCTEAEIADFEARLAEAPSDEEVLYNLCKFPDPWHDDQVSDYAEALETVVQNIPDEFPLTARMAANAPEQQGVGPEEIKRRLRLIRLIGSLAWLPLVVLPLLIAALAVRSLRGLSLWLGIPLLVGGVLTLLPALVYRAAITNALASGPLTETPEAVRAEVMRVSLRLAAEVFQPMRLEATGMLVLAIGLLALYAIRPRQRVRGPAAPPRTPAAP